MKHWKTLMLTALAPMIWGSSYIVTTELMPEGYPLTLALLRALPAGLLLLLIAPGLPKGGWWLKLIILGALNFAIFWSLLFVAAYRLPGGVAAILGAVQPLIVVFLASALLGQAIRMIAIISALAGLAGVAMLILSPDVGFDGLGIAAGLGGALSMALGSVLTRKWQPPVSLLTFTAWQLTAGGLLLLPIALVIEPPLPPLTLQNWIGWAWLCLIGAALTYILWFRGLARLEPSAIAPLGFLSPTSAVLLGWVVLDQALSPQQIAGVGIILASVAVSQWPGRTPQSIIARNAVS